MKKILSIAALSMLSLSSLLTAPAQAAGTVGSGFTVTANLTSSCLVATATVSDLNFGAYTSFGSAEFTAPKTSVTFKCTRDISIPTASMDTVVGADVVAGLTYTLAVAPGSKSAGTDTGGAFDLMTYEVTGTMASGQAGSVTVATSPKRTLTISY